MGYYVELRYQILGGVKVRSNKRIIIFVAVLSMLFSSVAYGAESAKAPVAMTMEEKYDYMNKIMEYIEAAYKYGSTKEEMYDDALKGIFDGLDRHSTYFNINEYEDFNADANGVFGGVGVSVSMRNGVMTVQRVLSDTPAEKAGMLKDDKIVRVDGEDVVGYSMEKTINMLRGEPKTPVMIGVQRNNSSDIVEIEVIRDIIKVNTIKSEVLDGGIGLITIENFNQNTSTNLNKVFKDFSEKQVAGLIIDLRDNPGGSLAQVLTVADMFVEKDKPLVHIEYKDGKRKTYDAQKEKIGVPLVVLVNNGSASASEIFAGAIKDNEVGTVIGTQTYGKGTVQKVTKLKTGGAIKLTIAEYLTPNGGQINGVGLTPNIVIKNPESDRIKELTDFVPMIENVDNKLNDRGLNIYGAQQRFHFIGYEAELTGILDQRTLDMITIFQESEGIEVTNVLDAETRARLNMKVRDILYSGTKDRQMEEALKQIKEDISKL